MKFPALTRLICGEEPGPKAVVHLIPVQSDPQVTDVEVERAVLRCAYTTRTTHARLATIKDVVTANPTIPADVIAAAVTRLLASGRLKPGILYPKSFRDTQDTRPSRRVVL